VSMVALPQRAGLLYSASDRPTACRI
jgi:hypothetical protein